MFYRYREGMLDGANLIDAGGLCIEINQRLPAEVAPATSRGHPHTPSSALLVVADFGEPIFANE